jgi:hypothetical protein
MKKQKNTIDEIRAASIIFIGLRNSVGAARSLATEFRDRMKLRQEDKMRYNNLVEYLDTFSKGMIPTRNPLNAEQRRDLFGYDLDYTAILMSVSMQLAMLDAKGIPEFIEKFEMLIDSYTNKSITFDFDEWLADNDWQELQSLDGLKQFNKVDSEGRFITIDFHNELIDISVRNMGKIVKSCKVPSSQLRAEMLFNFFQIS